MRNHLLILFIFLTVSAAHAKEYGNYDPKRMLTISETPTGKKYGLDMAYLDQILNDLSLHAKNYPPQFDTPQDRQRATLDVRGLSGMLDVMVNSPNPNPELLVRAAFVNSIGHNLDIAEAAEKANSIFQKLLSIAPSDPRGNYMYGVFLANSARFKEALPFLEKALAAGVADAAYSVGMASLALGNKEKALENLEAYRRTRPNDESIDRIIEAIRNGKIEYKTNAN